MGMHRLLVWTSKGGTGKTTTVSNLGPQLAREGYRVLLVGFDPQADLEASFGLLESDRSAVRVEQLLGGGIDPRQAVMPIEMPKKTKGSLSLLPCSDGLNEQLARVAREGFQSLDVILTQLEDDFDIAIIDTQGAYSPLSQTAVRAADSVLFSCEPGFFEARAIERRLDELEEIAARVGEDPGWQVQTLGILIVKTPKRSRHMREWREHYSDARYPDLPVFKTFIRASTDVREHPRHGVPTALLDPKHPVSEDYRAAAKELVKLLTAQVAA